MEACLIKHYLVKDQKVKGAYVAILIRVKDMKLHGAPTTSKLRVAASNGCWSIWEGISFVISHYLLTEVVQEKVVYRKVRMIRMQVGICLSSAMENGTKRTRWIHRRIQKEGSPSWMEREVSSEGFGLSCQ